MSQGGRLPFGSTASTRVVGNQEDCRAEPGGRELAEPGVADASTYRYASDPESTSERARESPVTVKLAVLAIAVMYRSP